MRHALAPIGIALGASLLLALGSLAAPVGAAAAADADTPQARRVAAERYLAVTPVSQLVESLLVEIERQAPALGVAEAHRPLFMEVLRAGLDAQFLEQTVIKGLTDTFTAREIDAMARFYGSPEGKAILAKFPRYMAEIMPAIQAHTAAATRKALEEWRARHAAPGAASSPKQ